MASGPPPRLGLRLPPHRGRISQGGGRSGMFTKASPLRPQSPAWLRHNAPLRWHYVLAHLRSALASRQGSGAHAARHQRNVSLWTPVGSRIMPPAKTGGPGRRPDSRLPRRCRAQKAQDWPAPIPRADSGLFSPLRCSLRSVPFIVPWASTPLRSYAPGLREARDSAITPAA